jgi:hypothetical protein
VKFINSLFLIAVWFLSADCFLPAATFRSGSLISTPLAQGAAVGAVLLLMLNRFWLMAR